MADNFSDVQATRVRAKVKACFADDTDNLRTFKSNFSKLPAKENLSTIQRWLPSFLQQETQESYLKRQIKTACKELSLGFFDRDFDRAIEKEAASRLTHLRVELGMTAPQADGPKKGLIKRCTSCFTSRFARATSSLPNAKVVPQKEHDTVSQGSKDKNARESDPGLERESEMTIRQSQASQPPDPSSRSLGM